MLKSPLTLKVLDRNVRNNWSSNFKIKVIWKPSCCCHLEVIWAVVLFIFSVMVVRELDYCLKGLQYWKNKSETPGLLLRQSVENRKRVTTRKHLLLLSPHSRAGMVFADTLERELWRPFRIVFLYFSPIIYLLTFSNF